MPDYLNRKRVGVIDIGVTADQVRLLAHQVDAQIESVNVDVRSAATDPRVNWDLRLGTAWLQFYNTWKAELAVAESNSWLTFGLGPEYERIRDYQAQAKDWQAKIRAVSGKPSSGPTIEDTRGDSATTYVTIAAIGAVVALGALLLLKR